MKFDFVFWDEKLISEDPVFVEVGSHSGRLGNFLKNIGRVIIYEPSKINFKNLESKVSGVELWNKGVAGFNGRSIFYDYKKGMSAASMINKNIPILSEYPIDVVNLETVFMENNIKKIDLLVLTCEGCEVNILDDIHKFDIPQVCVSFSDRIYGKKIKNDLIKKMSENYYITEGTERWKFHLLVRK